MSGGAGSPWFAFSAHHVSISACESSTTESGHDQSFGLGGRGPMFDPPPLPELPFPQPKANSTATSEAKRRTIRGFIGRSGGHPLIRRFLAEHAAQPNRRNSLAGCFCRFNLFAVRRGVEAPGRSPRSP